MKKLLIVLTVLILLVPCALSESSDAEFLRAFLEQHYGIIIRMGAENTDLSSEHYEIRILPEGSPPFQQLADENDRFDTLLRMMDDVFSVYPPDFFSHFVKQGKWDKLSFLLVDEVLRDGVKVSGRYLRTLGDLNIILARSPAMDSAIHHLIWHAIEFQITWDDKHVLDGWYDLDPEGFVYTGDYSILAAGNVREEPEDWFVNEYSKVNSREDMATVFEAVMTKDEAWWSTRPRLQAKAQFLLDRIEPFFGDLFPGE